MTLERRTNKAPKLIEERKYKNRGEINKIQTKNTMEKINKTKRWFF